jgi:hypothetical protein
VIDNLRDELTRLFSARLALAIDQLGWVMLADGRIAAGWRIGYNFDCDGRFWSFKVFPIPPQSSSSATSSIRGA